MMRQLLPALFIEPQAALDKLAAHRSSMNIPVIHDQEHGTVKMQFLTIKKLIQNKVDI
jgi:hypothetical protein